MRALFLLTVVVAAPAIAEAQGPDMRAPGEGWVAPPPPDTIHSLSTDLIDSQGYTRLHVTTRAMFSDGQSVFSESSAWAFEAALRIRIFEGLAISAVLPIGLTIPGGELSGSGFIGNVALGSTFAAAVLKQNDLELRLGGGLDVYLPSSPDSQGLDLAGNALVASMRAYEPQLYLPQTFSLRARFVAELRFAPFSAQVELGLVPAFALGRADATLLLFSGAGRVAAMFGEVWEPFIELAAAPQIAGGGEVLPPLMLTPGVRVHIADAFDPALFVSINFIETSALIIGLDLATLFRPSVEKVDPREREVRKFL